MNVTCDMYTQNYSYNSVQKTLTGHADWNCETNSHRNLDAVDGRCSEFSTSRSNIGCQEHFLSLFLYSNVLFIWRIVSVANKNNERLYKIETVL